MTSLPEIEAAVWSLNVAELGRLEQVVRQVRRSKENESCGSVLDLPPLEIGRLVQPVTLNDDLLGEMLDDTRF